MLHLALCEPEQFFWHPGGFGGGQIDAGVAGVACDKDFCVAEHLVIEAEGDLAEFGEVGDEGQLVVEEGWPAVVEERLDHDEAAAPALHVSVRVACGAQPFYAAYFEVGEVGGVNDPSETETTSLPKTPLMVTSSLERASTLSRNSR